MKTTAHTTVAERIGRGLGHAWFAIRRQEVRVVQHLMHQGLSRGVATFILWAAKLLVLGVLLYAAFWLTLVAIFVFAAAWLARHADHDSAQGEWRNGQEGYGYYENGTRTDYGRLFDDDQK
ncbi:DUF3742 family protein [Burkholderia pseudomallei]|uniref:DUF3742 family protein n=1 Tax=Burkholderia pseudomallei TaxID=28450 RepID=UPI000A1A2ABC|nr:DUF3742 family protein [Burkholderia pseudomallei]ARL24652.1 hypothetical protein BOC47_00550 [Burkholderia pseudomallei]